MKRELLKLELRQTFLPVLVVATVCLAGVWLLLSPTYFYIKASQGGHVLMAFATAGAYALTLVGGAFAGFFPLYRYWTTMFGRYAYFTRSIPVSGRALFVIKAAVAYLIGLLMLLWIDFVVAALSASNAISWRLMSLNNPEVKSFWVYLVDNIGQSFRTFFTQTPSMIIFFIFTGALALAAMQFGYLSLVSLGGMEKLSRLGVGGPVLLSAVGYVIAQASLIGTMVHHGSVGVLIHTPWNEATTEFLPSWAELAWNVDVDKLSYATLVPIGVYVILLLCAIGLPILALSQLERRNCLK